MLEKKEKPVFKATYNVEDKTKSEDILLEFDQRESADFLESKTKVRDKLRRVVTEYQMSVSGHGLTGSNS